MRDVKVGRDELGHATDRRTSIPEAAVEANHRLRQCSVP
jgi:hypothetical protein